jgi:hypothetical protein
LFIIEISQGQSSCDVGYTIPNKIVTTKDFIDWGKYPSFKLPFKIVYGGPRHNDNNRLPLKYGYSHLSTFYGDDAQKLLPQNRAMLWGPLNMYPNSNWLANESPWGNNTAQATKLLKDYLLWIASYFEDSKKAGYPMIDLWVSDTEKMKVTDNGILTLKSNPQTPATYKLLSDAEFLKRYKRDIQKMYIEPTKMFVDQNKYTSMLLSAYSDVPIRTNFLNIDGNSWEDWRTNPERINYISRDTINPNLVGGFDKYNDFLTPSAYFYYDFSHPFGPNYLAQLLFQIEANRAWSKKDIMVFEWMRYHPCCGPYPKQIEPFMAEAGAIFPFFSGANGIWLWEEFTYPTGDVLTSYDAFNKGLYRLSAFSDFFTGNYQLFIPKSGRDYFADKTPIWRGVVKNGKILVAAHNPYQGSTDFTNLTLNYGTWAETIKLTGHEVFLCSFDLPKDLPNIVKLNVFPNPSKSQVTAQVVLSNATDLNFKLTTLLGQTVLDVNKKNVVGEINEKLLLNALSDGIYLLTVKDLQTNWTQSVRVLVRQ